MDFYVLVAGVVKERLCPGGPSAKLLFTLATMTKSNVYRTSPNKSTVYMRSEIPFRSAMRGVLSLVQYWLLVIPSSVCGVRAWVTIVLYIL